MAQEGRRPLLKKSRWCVLKRKENLTSSQKDPAARVTPLQPPDRPGVSPQRGFPALLDLRLRGPPGPASFWISGAIAPCGPASSP